MTMSMNQYKDRAKAYLEASGYAGSWEDPEIRNLIFAIASGLRYAHEEGFDLGLKAGITKMQVEWESFNPARAKHDLEMSKLRRQ